jgi:glycerate kinase
VRFDERFEGIDVIITGEGSFDNSTRFGKAAWEVLGRWKGKKVRRVAACGVVDPAVVPEASRAFPGLELFSLEKDLGLTRSGAMEDAAEHLTALGRVVGNTLTAGTEATEDV